MSDVDLSEFFRLSRPRKKPCAVGYAASQVKAPERAKLDAACATDAGIITNAAVTEWLATRGQVVSVSAVVAHRKRTCSCGDA